MSKGKYSVGDLFGSRDFRQIIIPEIQRDYVWGKDNVLQLLKSLIDDAEEQAKQEAQFAHEELEKLPPALREKVEHSIEESAIYSNVGFIYAYEDNDFKSRFFLIDGQQRLTTIYLLLLAASILNEKENYFRTKYFNNNLAKVDYKVREASHDFLWRFIDFMLNNGKIDDVRNQYWYLTEFNDDRTIKGLIRNFRVIYEYLEKKNVELEFLEKNVELWFFNVNKSSQGEQLYIYMNSRGEMVQANENIKAEILEGLSEEDKVLGGEKWEVWQSFFWKIKGDNPCSDSGLNEFLRWVKITERIKLKPGKSVANHSRFIKNLRDSKKFDSNYISIPIIEKYFIALQKLIQEFEAFDFNVNWVRGYTNQADYFRLFPVLLYCTHYPAFELQAVKRLARFFKNVVQLPDVAKNPDDQTVNAIRLMLQFLSEEYTDVVDLLKFKERPEYKNILTEEEVFKLKLYAAQDMPPKREAIEEAFWKCEDFVLNAGRISFMLYCSGQKLEETELDNFNLKKFIKFSDSFIELFSKPTDELRRALLTKGDYTIKDGYSTNLWADRYTLGHNSVIWKRILTFSEHRNYIKKLLKEFIETRFKSEQSDAVLIRIINSYLNKEHKNDWEYQFIANPDIMAFCEEKKFVWGNDDFDRIYLMRRTKATDYRTLSEFVEE